jgi:hypothetical protein
VGHHRIKLTQPWAKKYQIDPTVGHHRIKLTQLWAKKYQIDPTVGQEALIQANPELKTIKLPQ